jgi:hypothetical protein
VNAPDLSISAAGRLAGSTAHLINHLATCDICVREGIAVCDDVRELMAIVRADRAPLVVAPARSPGYAARRLTRD